MPGIIRCGVPRFTVVPLLRQASEQERQQYFRDLVGEIHAAKAVVRQREVRGWRMLYAFGLWCWEWEWRDTVKLPRSSLMQWYLICRACLVLLLGAESTSAAATTIIAGTRFLSSFRLYAACR